MAEALSSCYLPPWQLSCVVYVDVGCLKDWLQKCLGVHPVLSYFAVSVFGHCVLLHKQGSLQ